jgi:nucleotide-binding universal stress UspA family protein
VLLPGKIEKEDCARPGCREIALLTANMAMKILIGHDGSDCSKSILKQLPFCGLPLHADVHVLTTAEVPVPIAIGVESYAFAVTPEQWAEYEEVSRAEIRHARRNADEVKHQILDLFPEWNVTARAVEGSASTQLLLEAEAWQPQLIIVGSHGKGMIRKFFLGSVSSRVLQEAHCSVRIVHEHAIDPNRPLTLLVAVDDSGEASKIVDSIAERQYPENTAVHLLTVADMSVVAALDYVATASNALADETESVMAREVRERMQMLVSRIRARYRDVHMHARIDKPRNAILEIAGDIGADAIIVGAKGKSALKRFLLGSVSSSVAQHSNVTVEVVRTPEAAS